MKKENLREIPKKNYIYVILLTVATCLALIYFVRWYNLRNGELATASVISDTVTEVSFSEIDNYLLENPYIMLYITDSENIENQEFEKDFANYIKKYELNSKIIYIDIAKLTDDELQKLNDKWLINSDVLVPNILLIENGVTKDQLYYTNQKINIDDVKNFLVRYEVNS